MFEKLCQVIDILNQKYGWLVKAYGDRDGWGILVVYVEEGPEFDYLVRLDNWAFKLPASYMAEIVRSEALGAMEVK